MLGVKLFQKPDIATECEACGRRFDIIHGGVCARCQRILCHADLNGSWLRRLVVDLGASPVCLDCRDSARGTRH